jgi:hypothetical protein
MQSLRNLLKRILPTSWIEAYRRRRALRRYLRDLAYEIYDRTIRLEREDLTDELEERVAARRAGFHDRLVRDVLERTELVLQELDRRIEGVSARGGRDLRRLEQEVAELRRGMDELRAALAEQERSPHHVGPGA